MRARARACVCVFVVNLCYFAESVFAYHSGLVIGICNMFQVGVLERRLIVALQNSKHSFDSGCPFYMPDNAQNLLVGYAEEARNESPLPGNAFDQCVCCA